MRIIEVRFDIRAGTNALQKYAASGIDKRLLIGHAPRVDLTLHKSLIFRKLINII